MTEFVYEELFQIGEEATRYRLLSRDGVSQASFDGQPVLRVAPEALTLLAREAMRDVNFLLRGAHLERLASIPRDPLASPNDRAVALAMLRNAEIAARFELPLCQDTGTATVLGWKGSRVWTDGDDARQLARGVYETWAAENLRYSQLAPLGTYEERNTGTNLPAHVELSACAGEEYRFLFMAKGGGSANKTALFQQPPALLRPEALEAFLVEKMKSLGTAACPPCHLAFVIGGLSPESCLKTVKLASAGQLDALPSTGSPGGRAFRDLQLEARMLEAARASGIGAQFGGRHFALDVRVVRLPRHGASLPIGLGVSCYADRQARARIDRDGVWLEQLERDPGRFIPAELDGAASGPVVEVDLRRPMEQILASLRGLPVGTRLSLTGPLVVARDLAHARLAARLAAGEEPPAYLRDHPIYYAGPARTPAGRVCGSLGPTTAGRMDDFLDGFQARGCALVTLAKGGRSRAAVEACRRHGGFYLGAMGGPAALLSESYVRKVEPLDFADLGMEAVLRIEVAGFPAFVVIDDRGNDLLAATGT